MIITEHPQADFFGAHLDYKTYWSNNPSSHLVCFFPGTEELGAGDGKQLDELDKFGFMRLAKAGFEFPFNIVAVQPSGSYSGFSKMGMPWLKMQFNPSEIINLGLSLGAIAAIDLLAHDTYNLVKAVVSLSGKASTPANIPIMKSIQGYAFHGMLDTTVNYAQAMSFYNGYNKFQDDNKLGGHFIINSVPGLKHGGWDAAMSVTPGQDDIYQFILKQFGPEPVAGLTYDDGYAAAKAKLIEAINAV